MFQESWDHRTQTCWQTLLAPYKLIKDSVNLTDSKESQYLQGWEIQQWHPRPDSIWWIEGPAKNIVFLFVKDSLAFVQYCLNRAASVFEPCTICTHRNSAAVRLPQSQKDDDGRPEQIWRGQRTCHGLLMQVSELQFFMEKINLLWQKGKIKFCKSFWKHYHWWANLLREDNGKLRPGIQIWKIVHSSLKLGETRYAEESDSCC